MFFVFCLFLRRESFPVQPYQAALLSVDAPAGHGADQSRSLSDRLTAEGMDSTALAAELEAIRQLMKEQIEMIKKSGSRWPGLREKDVPVIRPETLVQDAELNSHFRLDPAIDPFPGPDPRPVPRGPPPLPRDVPRHITIYQHIEKVVAPFGIGIAAVIGLGLVIWGLYRLRLAKIQEYAFGRLGEP
jgi:hypothetical protein